LHRWLIVCNAFEVGIYVRTAGDSDERQLLVGGSGPYRDTTGLSNSYWSSAVAWPLSQISHTEDYGASLSLNRVGSVSIPIVWTIVHQGLDPGKRSESLPQSNKDADREQQNRNGLGHAIILGEGFRAFISHLGL
jgi:hypothetical protein